MFMWNDEDGSELDRYMIALRRLQTDKIGRVAYRRLIGMHGGGGGTSDKEFANILRWKISGQLLLARACP